MTDSTPEWSASRHITILKTDLDNASWAYKTREFLERAEREGRVVSVTDDLPRSFVLVGGQEEAATVYITQLSSAALLGRAERNSFE